MDGEGGIVCHGTDGRPGVPYRRPAGDADCVVLEAEPSDDLPVGDRTTSEWCSRVHPEDRARLRDAIEAAESGEGAEIDVVYRIRDGGDAVDDGDEPSGDAGVGSDGTWITERGVRVDGGDEIVGYLFVAGERVERQRRLERQRERLEEFASVVSHDLRNPLSVAVGNLELARDLQGNAAAERLARVEDALDRMDSLIGDLLALAREGRTVTEPARTDLRTVVDRAWNTVGSAGPAELAIDGPLPTVDCDGQRLQRAFENLFRNAIEHGLTEEPPAGEVDGDDPADARSPAVRNDGGETVHVTVGSLPDGFYVADDGPGITPELQGRVFEPGRSSDPDGTGFGLAIVERIVTAHDWSIEATEAWEGGARFEIYEVESIAYGEGAVGSSTSSSRSEAE